MDFGGLEYVVVEFIFLPAFLLIIALCFFSFCLYRNIKTKSSKMRICVFASLIALVLATSVWWFMCHDLGQMFIDLLYFRPMLTLGYFAAHLIIFLLFAWSWKDFVSDKSNNGQKSEVV